MAFEEGGGRDDALRDDEELVRPGSHDEDSSVGEKDHEIRVE
jgi:hypothetical protein